MKLAKRREMKTFVTRSETQWRRKTKAIQSIFWRWHISRTWRWSSTLNSLKLQKKNENMQRMKWIEVSEMKSGVKKIKKACRTAEERRKQRTPAKKSLKSSCTGGITKIHEKAKRRDESGNCSYLLALMAAASATESYAGNWRNEKPAGWKPSAIIEASREIMAAKPRKRNNRRKRCTSSLQRRQA